MANTYTQIDLTHWEAEGPVASFVAVNGVLAITPETIRDLFQNFIPVGHREGMIVLDVPVESFLEFWSELGGEAVEK